MTATATNARHDVRAVTTALIVAAFAFAVQQTSIVPAVHDVQQAPHGSPEWSAWPVTVLPGRGHPPIALTSALLSSVRTSLLLLSYTTESGRRTGAKHAVGVSARREVWVTSGGQPNMDSERHRGDVACPRTAWCTRRP
jgi:hypothetical protein